MNPNDNSRRRVLQVLAAAPAALALTARPARADQPKMQSALHSLRDARRDLEKADDDKGGHRRRALELVREAIEQVEKGIAFDRKH